MLIFKIIGITILIISFYLFINQYNIISIPFILLGLSILLIFHKKIEYYTNNNRQAINPLIYKIDNLIDSNKLLIDTNEKSNYNYGHKQNKINKNDKQLTVDLEKRLMIQNEMLDIQKQLYQIEYKFYDISQSVNIVDEDFNNIQEQMDEDSENLQDKLDTLQNKLMELKRKNKIEIKTYYILQSRLNEIEKNIYKNEKIINNNQECIQSGFDILKKDLNKYNDELNGIKIAPEKENIMIQNEYNDLINEYSENPEILKEIIEKNNNKNAKKCFNIV